MEGEIRRFPSLESNRAPSSQHTRQRRSVSTSLISASSSLSRFPSVHSTRPSTRTSVTIATSPSLLACDDEHGEQQLSRNVSLLEPADVSLYKEVPLLDTDSIRILRVKPGSPGMPLDCELLTTNPREQKNRYSALSYTWEPDIASVPVRINGRTIDMQQNLVDFICTIRSPSRHIRLWADAVCIDQQSTIEKTHQVQLISKIHSNAACTQSWLGNDMPALTDQMKVAKKCPESNDDRSTGSTRTASEDVLFALLNHRYWNHTWVIQDILLARDVWVHCGNAALQWNDLVRMARRLANAPHRSTFCYLQLLGGSKLMHLHNMRRRSARARGLPHLLTQYAETGCGNVQDRVFSLIGLINERNDPLFSGDIPEAVSQNRNEVIDYSLPLKDLFRKLVDMYSPLPARSFALPLWSALDLNFSPFDSLDYCQRISIQGFPCSMLTMSRSYSRTLIGPASTMDLDETTREELLCLSDPYSKVKACKPRICVAIRVQVSDIQMSEQYPASACLVEPRGLAYDNMCHDELCRAFESTRVFRKPQSSDAGDIWTIDLPLTALKALHAILNPTAGQRLLDGLAEDVVNTEEIDSDPAEWVEATNALVTPWPNDTESVSTPETKLLSPEPGSNKFLLTDPREKKKEQKLPVRTKRRYRILKHARLNGIYDWMVRPLYGDKLPMWE